MVSAIKIISIDDQQISSYISQLQASYVSRYIEELWYNETVRLGITIYTLPHGGWALCRRNFRLQLA